ncbi:hypothetical protein KCP75_03565 [Salmonella enterica subsp. enterica]|nr:hypothetical protein KCP75_03565 [Salmonella enterica subsp. enterica]
MLDNRTASAVARHCGTIRQSATLYAASHPARARQRCFSRDTAIRWLY